MNRTRINTPLPANWYLKDEVLDEVLDHEVYLELFVMSQYWNDDRGWGTEFMDAYGGWHTLGTYDTYEFNGKRGIKTLSRDNGPVES